MSAKISENKTFREVTKTIVLSLVLMVLIFMVAAITKLKETATSSSSDSVITTATTSFIDNIIPTTKSKTDILEEINKIFTLYTPPVEEEISRRKQDTKKEVGLDATNSVVANMEKKLNEPNTGVHL